MDWSFPSFYRLVPEAILQARWQRAAELLAELGLDGMLVTNAVDLYYLSGTSQQGALFLDRAGGPRLFVRRHPPRARAESPVPVEEVSGFGQVARALGLPPGTRLGLFLDLMPAREYLGWGRRLPGVELVDMAGPWLELKGVKDAFEIEAIGRAGRIALESYAQVPRLLTEGKSEAQLAGEILTYGMARGGMNLVNSRGGFMGNYNWHLVAGPPGGLPSTLDAAFGGLGPSPAFPQGASLRPIGRGEPVIVDVGWSVEGYMTDQTRTYCLGPAADELHRAHQCLEAVEAALLAELKPGAVSGRFYELAWEVAREHGMERWFLGRPGHRIRFVGHGVGQELGAPPYLLEGSRARVRAGEVYALELKIVLPAGPVGLENTVLVNPQGPPTILTPIPGRLQEV